MKTLQTLPRLLSVLLGLSVTEVARGQGTRADYERAGALRRRVENTVFRDRVRANWIEGNRRFWYQVKTGPDSHEFVLVDATQGVRSAAFDHGRLSESLRAAGVENARADRLPIDSLEFDRPANVLRFTCNGKTWQCDLQTYKIAEAPLAPGKPAAPAKSKEKTRTSRSTDLETEIIFVNQTGGEVELFWIPSEGERRSYGKIAAGAERRQHTYSGHLWQVVDGQGRLLGEFRGADAPLRAVLDGQPKTTAPEKMRARYAGQGSEVSPNKRWRAQIANFNIMLEDMESGEKITLTREGTAEDGYGGRLSWSPDSKYLVAVRTRRAQEHKVYLIESSPKDQVQPKLLSYDYLKPGDRIARPQPHLFDVEARQEIPIQADLFSNPWSLTDIRWARDSGRFTFLYNQRGHQVLRIVAVEVKGGEARAIVEEQSKTFIDYAGKQFVHWLASGDELIWMSERDGWNHLYLYDAKAGKVKNQITRGEWVVRGVDRVDESARQIWFRAGGIRPEQDPYYIHYCRINFDGSGLTILTEGDGNHSAEFSPDRRYLIDTWSRVDQPPVIELRRADNGKRVCELERADWTALLKTGWRPPERFVAKGRDGTTDIYGVIFRPTNFDPKVSYPVIESIYAGPQSAYVPKSFRPFYGEQTIAELGFIVVKIDGMGTSHRSKAFHDVCWKNLADAGLPDRVLWIRAAAEKYPYMDLNRVGIYGGSAGGQSALGALLTHGDFYKVAVADCGCHDNRMDKIWWNELWMGWPVGPHYAEQSNVTLAHKLQGKLLLIVGELDRNVDPASTLQVVNALIKANKDFDLLIIPGTGHGAAETPYGQRRRQDFFVRHLLGVEPRR